MEEINTYPQTDFNKAASSLPSDEQGGIKSEKTRERVFLGTTKDGAEVFDRTDFSHFHNEGGMTVDLMAAAISKIDTKGKSFLKEKVDFDKPIGETTCVNVGPEDEIVMVYRKGRSGQTPMVKNREAEPCNSVIVLLKKDRPTSNKNSYELTTGYIGDGSPREPWDPNISTEEEKDKCENFWKTHALIYDDSLIDWKKTKEFEFMSPAMRKAELIRPKVLFSGLFINPDELYKIVQPTLEKPIMTPHVTTAFKPGLNQLNLAEIGANASIMAIGYGNDGVNEGLLVKIQSDDPEVQKACDALETPHITLSISKRGQAKDTAFLKFEPIKEPFEIKGRYGVFVQGAPIIDPDKLISESDKIDN